jgi:nitroimidazol reductase NimA-like FMN-containing flavoprotein (pyridoxamine 5'-phosphate oxidase superfamily)
MSTQRTDSSLEHLTEAECLDLLAAHHLGRLAVVVDGQPQIFPVNYAFGDRIVAIRTADGTKLTAARNAHVAFEIDDCDADGTAGWSVVVHGVAYDITEAPDRQSALARQLGVQPLAPGRRDRWLGIHPVGITGRRFQPSS